MSRIAIFGGTFDPPHNAHVALANAALEAFGLAEVRWVPAGDPWQKARAITPAVHRAAMVEAAIRGANAQARGKPRFTIDRLEIARAGPSVTLDTVIEFQAREPGHEWVLLIGQDQYAGLHTWRGWRELLARVTLAVANRPGVTMAPAPEVRALPHRAVPLPMLDISATDIRARVAAGRDITSLVPAEVAGYISRHGLYRDPATA
jgi:nicotinate-nucleotide adenylyltransferase